MILTPEEIFLHLIREDSIQKLYDAEQHLSQAKEKALEDLSAVISFCARKANYWAMEGEPYGFWTFKVYSKNFIALLQFIKNDENQKALTFVSGLSNSEKEMIPFSVSEFLKAVKIDAE